jgi:hypothetical protein
MKGLAARSTAFFALASLLVAATASGGGAASLRRGQISGVVPHSAPPAVAPQLFSGPMPLTFDASYETLINQYLTDVAHDSGGGNNVYSVATQYSDTSGAVQYQSTFGGSYVDHDPLPANGCDDGVDAYCLTDTQIAKEIQAALTAKGWHGGLNHVFFLMTPNGVGSCFDTIHTDCTSNFFCAYHNFFVNSQVEDVIYANEPYMGPTGRCNDPSQGFPNNPDADTTINTISHEHNEAITDPLTDPNYLAWVAADGNEIGDLCARGYGTQTGTGAGVYNQVINGHHYDLQQEYSNADGGCVQHLGGPATPPTFSSGPVAYQGGPVMHTNTTYAIYWLPTPRNTSPPVVAGTAAIDRTLTTTEGAWDGATGASSYQWQRCSSTGKKCADITGATASTYKVAIVDAGHVLRSAVRATNVNGASPRAASTGTDAVIDTPALTKRPRVSGIARVGKKLSGGHGSWSYSPSFTRQWLRCNAHGRNCLAIPDATTPSYKLTALDGGHKLRVHVTATNAAGSSSASSAASPRVQR